METSPIRETGLSVTRLGLGTAPLGGLYEAVSEETAIATVDAAWESGARLFDTAPLYGMGDSEVRLGRALRERPRDEYVLATKVGRLLRPADPSDADPNWQGVPLDVAPVFDFSYDGALRSFEESLARLGVDRIDIVHVHDPDDAHDAALSGAHRALLELRDQGVIGAVGAGMNTWQALLALAREAHFDCFLLAGRYTLLDQSALPELLPECAAQGIAVLAGGVYNSGILADPEVSEPRFDYQPAAGEVVQRARRIGAVCRNHGVPLRAAALQFPSAHPAVASVVVGARSPHEAAENARLLACAIPADLWAELKDDGLLPPRAPTP
jgi:D-threo-aldose 1-dehydrogenase